MSARYHREDDEPRDGNISHEFPPLPTWIGRKLLAHDEHVTWVRGPEYNPGWERYLTHPLLFVFALVLAMVLMVVGWAVSREGIPVPAIVTGIVLVLGSIFVLGGCNAYFTRLVVTNHRLMILQGYELVRSWRVDRLPQSLVRDRRPNSEQDSDIGRTVDLESLKSILGGSSDNSSTSMGIMAFGKQIERIRADEKRDRD